MKVTSCQLLWWKTGIKREAEREGKKKKSCTLLKNLVDDCCQLQDSVMTFPSGKQSFIYYGSCWKAWSKIVFSVSHGQELTNGYCAGFPVKSASTSVSSIFATVASSVKGKMLKIAGVGIKPALFSKATQVFLLSKPTRSFSQKFIMIFWNNF